MKHTLIFILGALIGLHAHADDNYIWTGATDSTWGTGSNWDPTIPATPVGPAGPVGPLTGTYNDAELNLNGSGSELIYTAAYGTTVYNGNRGLVIGSGGGDGTLRITGGTFSNAGGNEVVIGNSGGTGRLIVDGGNWIGDQNTGGIGLLLGFGGSSSGILTVNSGTADVNNIRLGRSSSESGTVNMNGGELRTQLIDNAGNGVLNLDGGTLRVDSVSLGGVGDAFNWGDGTLTLYEVNAGASGTTDYSGTGLKPVQSGTTLAVTGDIDVLGVNPNSVLELNGVYGNNGARQDILTVSGTLDLSGTNDELRAISSAYTLRPLGGLSSEYGSIPLVTAGSITGSFDSFLAPLDDVIGFTEFAGSFTSASALPLNTWHLEQTGTQVVFHYKVQGAVPEPGTTALLALGMLLYRVCHQRRGRHGNIVG